MPTSTYTLASPTGYIIHDRPDEKHPIRRLQSDGADSVHVNDLLSIALGGISSERSLISEYGVGFLRTLQSVSDITETLHIDSTEATKLLAILELGKRLYQSPQGSLVNIRGIEDVYDHFRAMSQLAKEQLRVALINSHYQLVHEETLAIGSTEYLHIQARDIFQPAVERRVTAIILVHNHPSGDSTPSQSDSDFTEHMVAAGKLLGIELLDHVIIGADSYTSCLQVEVPEKS